MRMRRDMREPPWCGTECVCECYARRTLRREACGPLEPELLAHDPRDLAAVGAALRLAHDEADDHADRLHVALSQLVDDIGVRVEGLLHDRLERVAAADRAEALALHDRARVAALG